MTASDDRVLLGLYASHAPDIVFGMDSGGSDGRCLLVMRRTGPLDTTLILVDLESSEATPLTPHTPPVMYAHGQFAPDGRTIFFTTDATREFSRVARPPITRPCAPRL